MLKLRKVISIFLGAVMMTATLIGCKSVTPVTSSTPVSSAVSSESPTAKPVTLKWYIRFAQQKDQQVVFDKVSQYMQEKINASVNFVPVAGANYNEKMSAVIASNEDYDICFTSSWANNYLSNVSKGAFLPLDDLLPTYAPAIWNLNAKFWDAVKVKGKIYGIINQQIFARAAAISIKKEEAKQFNFDSKTYVKGDLSSLNSYIEKAYSAAAGARYVHVEVSDMSEYLKQDWIVGYNVPGAVDVTQSKITVVNQWKTASMNKLVDTLQDWNSKGWTSSKKFLSGMTQDLKNEIVDLGGTYKPGGAVETSLQVGVDLDQIASNDLLLTTGGIIATLSSINRNSKNPERALMMLNILFSDKYAYNLLNYGVEGTHYKLNGEGKMITASVSADYNPQVSWELASQFMSLLNEGQDTDLWEQTKKLNQDATKSTLLGFSFDPTPVSSEIAKSQAVVAEYYQGICLGIYTDKEYEQFLTKLDSAGTDKIIAEMQSQIDKWQAAK